MAAQPNHRFLPVIHVYARQNYFRWELIAEARDAFGKDKIVCTEYGSRDDIEDGSANPQLERELAGLMVTHFRAPDLLLAHTFWNNYTDEAVASHGWYHNDEITPKGQQLLEFFFDYP